MGDGRARGWKPGWEQPVEACGPSFGEAGTIALFPALETVHVGSLRPTPQFWSPSSSGWAVYTRCGPVTWPPVPGEAGTQWGCLCPCSATALGEKLL